MGNKKGFVLIETIVTITVLAASLLYIYSHFNNILIKEKTRLYYDDPAYIYRTYYLKEFFKANDIGFVLSLINDDNPLVVIGCEYEGLFEPGSSEKNACNKLWNSLGISKVAVGLNQLKYIRNCSMTSSDTKCSYLNYFSIEQRNYMKSLGNITKEKELIMIVEYLESDASSNKVRNYAWIEL